MNWYTSSTMTCCRVLLLLMRKNMLSTISSKNTTCLLWFKITLIIFIGAHYNKFRHLLILSFSGRRFSFTFWDKLLSTTMIMLLSGIKLPHIMLTLAQNGKTLFSNCCIMLLITLSKRYFIFLSIVISFIHSLFNINLRLSFRWISLSISWKNGQARRTFRCFNCWEKSLEQKLTTSENKPMVWSRYPSLSNFQRIY